MDARLSLSLAAESVLAQLWVSLDSGTLWSQTVLTLCSVGPVTPGGSSPLILSYSQSNPTVTPRQACCVESEVLCGVRITNHVFCNMIPQSAAQARAAAVAREHGKAMTASSEGSAVLTSRGLADYLQPLAQPVL